jgi:hypothetical protein
MQYLNKRNYLIAMICAASACAAEPASLADGEQLDEPLELPADGEPSESEQRADDGDKQAREPAAGLAEDTACLTVYTPPDEPTAGDKAIGDTRVVFLNRRGGTYTRGSNNSSTNVSSIPTASSVTLPAYEGSEADWQSLMSCVRSQYARFNVQITDVDPGAAMHIEAVVGGSSSALGYASNVGGVSPFNCGVISRSIVYVFSRAYGSVRGECEAVAHEIGHSLGLEHEYLCQDPMTYLYGCGNKTFQDAPAQCGTSSAVACQCGSATQNTVQKLLANVGPATGTSPTPPTTPVVDAAPTVTVTAPTAGAVYARGASVRIRATAADDRAVREVKLSWTSPAGTSSYRLNSLGGTSYGLDLRLSSSALLGTRTLVVQAVDDAGQTTSAAPVSIQVR